RRNRWPAWRAGRWARGPLATPAAPPVPTPAGRRAGRCRARGGCRGGPTTRCLCPSAFRGRGSWRRARRRRSAHASARESTAHPTPSAWRDRLSRFVRRSRQASRVEACRPAWERSGSLDSYGHRGLAGRLRRTAQHGFGEQRAGRAGRDVRGLHVERMRLQMIFESAEADAGLYEPLEHAHVVGRPHVTGTADDDGAGQAIAAEEQLAVRRAVALEAADDLRLRIVPRAEG